MSTALKSINDLHLESLVTGLTKTLVDELGGEFKVTVQKVERTKPGSSNDTLLLNFVVEDKSYFFRNHSYVPDMDFPFGPAAQSIDVEDFKARTLRTESDTAVVYDVRPLQGEQQSGVANFLGELVFKLNLKTLTINKPIVLLVDNAFECTDQLDGFIQQLNAAGLPVSIREQLGEATAGT